MLDDTLVLTLYVYMVFWSSSWHQAHIVIQAYTYNHAIIHMQSCNDVAHGYMKHSYEKHWLWLSDFWSLHLPPMQFTRVIVESLVSAPATRAVHQIVGHIFCPASWQLAKLIFKILVSTPAIGAVQQIDCRISGLCACHLCSFPKWWLDSWSLLLPPAVYQIVCQIFCSCTCDLAVNQTDFQNVGVCACHRWSSEDWLSDL